MDLSIPVLIVDDHMAMRGTIGHIMRRFGFSNIAFAEDGIMAWEMMQDASFGLILLDWNMPRMSGIELLKKIRGSGEAFSGVPVLAVTAEAEQMIVEEAIQNGVSNYIVKPFTPATLERKIRAIFPDFKPRA